MGRRSGCDEARPLSRFGGVLPQTIVDSSVWIDYFNGRETPATKTLDILLGAEPVALGDLIVTEVLQGFQSDRDFEEAKRLFSHLTVVEMTGADLAIEAASNYRKLRKRGVTVRKTIDIIIATRCIEDGYELLHDDRDFDPCAEHLGLRVFPV